MRAEPPGRPHVWLDDDAGPVVRPYTVTGGRVAPVTGDFDLVAFVLASPDAEPDDHPHLHPEHRQLVELAGEPMSVAELAAHLNLAVGVVRVLVGDLLAGGLVDVHEPPTTAYLPDDNILKAVANGLRAL
ncbi:DUF742 domain-containing protein [Micromonospora sp. WMMD882]|uniref:DUF742 domain-containing protein n=1 Tax=Micromonospora sp. WMMD882 TaxID=3015151 RepID=UPI00248AD1F4|nr:DUF742 domain-containing protein [Micromonospora sp. WMMD882]WBB79507.1 DUF742 domain-containing protein [Micromonospora sp. WMMD882]